MLAVTPITNDHFDSLAYVVSRPGRREALVIDPAEPASGRIASHLEASGLTAAFILLTHEHFDHMAGVTALRERTGARLVCSCACSESITDPKKNFSRYLIGVDLACAPADLLCEDLGHMLDWCGLRVEFIPTPGHSPGSVCIAVSEALFTGDTLLQNYKTVTKLPGGNRRQLEASLDTLLARFSAATMVYPGHGDPFPIGATDRDLILGRAQA